MQSDQIGVGLLGTGFARSAQIPALRAIAGARLVAVASGRRQNAVATAAEFDIPRACEDYRQLVALDEVELVVVATPPHLHHPVTLAALEAGKHVICEKPMAMHAGEAREMEERAAARPGQLAVIDHELRFNPTRRRLKELIDGGFLGELHHVQVTVGAGFRHSAQRPWNWWSQKSAGGGLLGALGSHVIDQLRWLFGEIAAVSGSVATLVPARPDPETGELRRVETDDYCSFLARFAPRRDRAAHATVILSALYASGGRNQMLMAGDRGTLVLDGDEQLLGAGGYGAPLADFSVPDPARAVPGVPDNVWARAFYHFAGAAVGALREGRAEIPQAATFRDGRRCQEVIDAILRADEERRWVDL